MKPLDAIRVSLKWHMCLFEVIIEADRQYENSKSYIPDHHAAQITEAIYMYMTTKTLLHMPSTRPG